MSRWCTRCGHEYKSVAEARKSVGCPRCGGFVMASKPPVLTSTAERREQAATVTERR